MSDVLDNQRRQRFIKLADIIFFLYIVGAVVTEHSLIGNVTLLAFLGLCSIIMFMTNKIVNCNYFVFSALFVVYCICQSIFKIPENLIVANARLTTLLICFVFEFLFFQFLIYRNDFDQVVRIYISANFVGLVVNLVCNFGSLLEGRLTGVGDDGIYMMGIKIGDLSAVAIGWIAGTCLFFVALLYMKNEKAKFYRYYIFFSLMIAFSGTRKMIVFIPLSTFIVSWFNTSDKQRYIKMLRTGFRYVLVAILMIYACFNVPVLYNVIGHRLESLVTYMILGVNADASLYTRMRLIEIAKRAFDERPVFGWGLDNFKHVFYHGKYYSHNNFYELLVSGGIVGFILYYSKYIYLLARFRKFKGARFKYLNSLLALFILIIILEYWQVSYFDRRNTMFLVILLSYLKSQNESSVNTISNNLNENESNIKVIGTN